MRDLTCADESLASPRASTSASMPYLQQPKKQTVKNCVLDAGSHLWRACILTVAGGYLRRQQAGALAAPPLIIGPYNLRCTLVLPSAAANRV